MAPSKSENFYPIYHSIMDFCREIGVDEVGFVKIDDTQDNYKQLSSWLGLGYHGTMAWMEKAAHIRANPKLKWPKAKTVIVIAISYFEDGHLNCKGSKAIVTGRPSEKSPPIAAFARGNDYHQVLMSKLKLLEQFIAKLGGSCQSFVDTARVMEKPLAHQAGIGWQGKHTNLVSKKFGSYLLLGCLFTDLELITTPQHTNNCGKCTACLDICPTKAFPAPYVLDARKCISYLTIEHHGSIPIQYRDKIGTRIFGCDDCLVVCPWNKFAKKSAVFQSLPLLAALDLEALSKISAEKFVKIFDKTTIIRLGYLRYLRNLAIALGNSGSLSFKSQLEELTLHHDSTVSEAAEWGLHQLLNPKPITNQ